VPSILIPTIRAVGNIATGSDQQTQRVNLLIKVDLVPWNDGKTENTPLQLKGRYQKGNLLDSKQYYCRHDRVGQICSWISRDLKKIIRNY